MGYLGRQSQNDLLFQLNGINIRIGTPLFAKLEHLTVLSGALLPVFDSLVVAPSGTSILGTVVSSSLWQGSGIQESYGGTGQVSYSVGDLLYALNASTLAKLPAGSAGQGLVLAGGIPSWGDGLVVTGQTTYGAQDADRFIMASGQVTVNLPGSPAIAQKHTIKDVAGVGAASGVTINGVAGLIDGAASTGISVDFDSLNFVWHGTAWAVY